jgi:hypothetical protein
LAYVVVIETTEAAMLHSYNFQSTRSARAVILSEISDLKKAATGSRMHRSYAGFTLKQLIEERDDWMRYAEIEWDREEQEYKAATQRWEEDIKRWIAIGAGTRKVAIRWDMEAYEIKEEGRGFYDVGFYCYKRGLPYRLESSIMQTLR